MKKLDAIFSQFIRKRDKRCVICGTTQDLTCGHLFSRVCYSTRWSEINCHCQCKSCNWKHEDNPHPFTIWFLHHFGISAYISLNEEHNKLRKFQDYEIAEMTKLYNQKFNELQS